MLMLVFGLALGMMEGRGVFGIGGDFCRAGFWGMGWGRGRVGSGEWAVCGWVGAV